MIKVVVFASLMVLTLGQRYGGHKALLGGGYGSSYSGGYGVGYGDGGNGGHGGGNGGGYGGGYGGGNGGGNGGGYGGGYGGGHDYAQPIPYDYGYDIAGGDHHSGEFRQSRKESGDGHGNVQGSYGYTDAHGNYRQVDYVADHHGFRAQVKTNEPGTDHQSPADAHFQVEQSNYRGGYGGNGGNGGGYGGGHRGGYGGY